MEHTNGNRVAMDYHLFSPKFENHVDSNGYQDTWRAPQPEYQVKKQAGQEFGGPEGRDYHPGRPPVIKETPRRGQRVPMPSRVAPPPPSVYRQQHQHQQQHQLGNNSRYVTPFPSAEQQIDQFNSSIDSMHLPDDLSRPVATRDMVKRMHDDKLNAATTDLESSSQNHFFDYAQPLSDRKSKEVSLGDNDFLSDRQFEISSGAIGGPGSFEDMFY